MTRNGKPVAVLLNFAAHMRLKETLDVLSDAEAMGQLRQSRAFYRKNRRGLSFEDVFGEPLILKKKRR